MQRKKPAGQQRATGADFTGHPVARAPALPLASHSHVAQGGCGASDMTAWPAACLSVSWSVRVGWGCFALLIRAGAAALCARSRGEPSSARCGESWLVCDLLIRAGTASLCARTRGEPSSAHCEQRLSERLTPCPCDPVCACTGMRGHAKKGKATCISVCAPTRSAASRAVMAGWAGEGGGRFGERREYEAPTLPSTPRQHGMARHHTRQPRINWDVL